MSTFRTILLIISHTSTLKQDNVAEWLTRLVAIQIPLGAQVRVLPLSLFFCLFYRFRLEAGNEFRMDGL